MTQKTAIFFPNSPDEEISGTELLLACVKCFLADLGMSEDNGDKENVGTICLLCPYLALGGSLETASVAFAYRQFASVFSRASTTKMPDLGTPVCDKIRNIEISTDGVKKLLNDVKPHKASGPRFLKNTSDQLAPAPTLLFQASLKQGQIPKDWKHARVAPICKTV